MESPLIEEFKNCEGVALGLWFSSGLGSVVQMVVLNDLRGLL